MCGFLTEPESGNDVFTKEGISSTDCNYPSGACEVQAKTGAVFERMIELIADQLGVDAETITEKSKF